MNRGEKDRAESVPWPEHANVRRELRRRARLDPRGWDPLAERAMLHAFAVDSTEAARVTHRDVMRVLEFPALLPVTRAEGEREMARVQRLWEELCDRKGWAR